MTPLPAATLDRLAAEADHADELPDWPVASWDALRAAGALGWAVPPAFGGAGLGPVEILRGTEAIAAACLTTAFALSQREAAIRQLLKGPPHLKERYLPALAAGGVYLTVGLSQLTTSRRHTAPALRATPTAAGGYRLDGEVPWVTGADRAAAVVIGATLPDANQILFVVPTDRPGVTVDPPLPLAALVGSRTSGVRCDGVEVRADEVLAGPAEQVLGAVGGGGLETSCLALGLAAAATGFIRQEATVRPDLVPAAERFETATAAARARLHGLAVTPDPTAALDLRVTCSRLALTASQAALLAAKGAGFVAPHPARRWARQALFFLVWSCPRPVAAGVLDGLLP